MLIVIYPDIDIWNFVLQEAKLEDKDIVFVPLNRFCNKPQRICRQLFPTSSIPAHFLFGGRLRMLLKSLNIGDSLVLCDYTAINITKNIKKLLNPKVNLYLWYWNPILSNPIMEDQIRIAKELDSKVFTFNKLDAEKYDLHLANQFFPMFISKDATKSKSDFYFQGYDKGRKIFLDKLKKSLNRYNTVINIVSKSSETIHYSEYIKNVNETRCLIDIVQEGQSGITLRPLEAIAFNKKLLTNNRELLKYSFYRKDNIFILGVDDMDSLDDFLNGPYTEIDIDTKMEYDTKTWISNFK